MGEYFCELTSELDKLTNIDPNSLWKHYILADNLGIKDKCFKIRIPGGTLGSIEYDENYIITRVFVDTDYAVKTYPSDVNEQIKKFVGQKIEFLDQEDKNMKNLVKALKRFDSLEAVIAELEVYDRESEGEVTIEDLADYLNDEAVYAIQIKINEYR